jgi:hypothetical protein
MPTKAEKKRRQRARAAGRPQTPPAPTDAPTPRQRAPEGQSAEVVRLPVPAPETAGPPAEGLARRLEAMGVHVPPRGPGWPEYVRELAREHGLVARDLRAPPLDSGFPLDVLLERRWLGSREDAARRHDAGTRFAWLHWLHAGRPFGGAIPLPIAQDPLDGLVEGETSALTGAERQCSLEWYWRDMRRALTRRGPLVAHVTMATVPHCTMPGGAQLPWLLIGLDALAAVKRPDLDAVREAVLADERRLASEAQTVVRVFARR